MMNERTAGWIIQHAASRSPHHLPMPLPCMALQCPVWLTLISEQFGAPAEAGTEGGASHPGVPLCPSDLGLLQAEPERTDGTEQDRNPNTNGAESLA
jgi:hypothetical protein